MPGCWIREDFDWEWKPEVVSADVTVDVTDNPVVAVLFGPDGNVVSQLLEREPIGYRRRV